MRRKVLLFLIFCFVFLGFAAWLTLPRLIDAKVRDFLNQADTASYRALELDFWAGDLTVHDLYIHDTSGTFWHQPINVSLKAFSVKGFKLWPAWRHRTLKIDSLQIGKGQIYLGTKKDSARAKNSIKSAAIRQIIANHVHVDALALTVDLHANHPDEKLSGTINLNVNHINVPFNANAALHYEQAKLHVIDLYLQPKASLAWFTADSLTLNSTTKKLQLHNIKMRQRLSQFKYAEHFGYDKDFVTLDVYRAEVRGLPTNLTALNEGIELPYLSLLGAQAYIYKDKRLPHNKNEKKFFIERLQEVQFPIQIDTIDLIDAQLLYDENWRKDHKPGRLQITDLQTRIRHLTNKTSPGKTSWTLITGELTLYEQVKLALDWRFDLTRGGQAFTLDLHLGKMQLKTFNPFTENTLGLRFKAGSIKHGRLLVEGNKKDGGGTLNLLYDGLNLEFIDIENQDKNLHHWLEGGAANLLVLNKNKAGKHERQGIVFAEYQNDQAIFNYVMRLFFSGFKDIAITSNNDKKLAQRGMFYLPLPEQVARIKAKKVAKAEKKSARNKK